VRHCLAYSIIFKETEKRYVPFWLPQPSYMGLKLESVAVKLPRSPSYFKQRTLFFSPSDIIAHHCSAIEQQIMYFSSFTIKAKSIRNATSGTVHCMLISDVMLCGLKVSN
jgi:hypothetical protein